MLYQLHRPVCLHPMMGSIFMTNAIWRVCDDYKLVEPKDRLRYLEPLYPLTRKDKWRTVEPLAQTDLFLSFVKIAKQGASVKTILQWVRKYRLLGLSGRYWLGGPKDTIGAYMAEAHRAWEVVRLYEAVLNEDEEEARSVLGLFSARQTIDDERLGDDDEWYEMTPLEHALVEVTSAVTKRVNDLCYRISIPPKRSHDVSKIRSGWGFKNLLGAMYLQMDGLLESKRGLTRCDFCGDLILLDRLSPTGRKPPSHKRYCNKSCRDNYNYRYKKKPKREASRS